MSLVCKFLVPAIVGMALLSACSDGALNVDAPEKPLIPVDPMVPSSMADCETDQVFAGQTPLRLLTRYEYDNTVRDLLGTSLRLGQSLFPPENAVAGFENNSDSHRVSPLLMRKFMEAAEELSTDAAPRLIEDLNCTAQDLACQNQFLDEFLSRAFRRPLKSDEREAFATLFEDSLAAEGFSKAVEYTIQAALQSPQFLYRIEFNDRRSPGELVQVDSYEMASRLSYFLWGSMPDATLLEAAESQKLNTPEEVAFHTQRMLEDPRAHTLIFEFYRQWLGLDALQTMVKDNSHFPEWDPAMSEAWRESLRAFIASVHQKNGDVRTLLTSTTVHLPDAIAPIYAMQPSGQGMTEYTMSADERAGLLTHPAVMALLAYPSQSSPIHRGIFVRERLLCQKLPSPPDNLQIEPPDPNPTATTREIFQQHAADSACSGCHNMIDPIGLGFENYDTLGRYRTEEHGLPVDASGALTNTADPAIGGEFVGGVQLAQKLADAREVEDCIADHWFTFALGHPETTADMCSAEEIRLRFNASNGKFEDLFTAITTSDAFRFRTLQVEGEQE